VPRSARAATHASSYTFARCWERVRVRGALGALAASLVRSSNESAYAAAVAAPQLEAAPLKRVRLHRDGTHSQVAHTGKERTRTEGRR
jgi:hypothetical protein